jgi:cytochrome P450
MLNLISEDIRRNPYPFYEAARGSSPLVYMPDIGMYFVFDYEGVKRALTDHESFSSIVTPPTGRAPDWLVFMDPPRHTQYRALIMRAFTPRSVSGLEPRIREISRELLAPHLPRGEMDLVTDYSGLLPTIVIAEMLGIPPEDRQRFLQWGDAIMGLSYALYGGEQAQQRIQTYADAREQMRLYVQDILAARRRAPQDDLLTRLVEAEVDGHRLSEEDILGFFQLLLSAGTETTTNLIANAMLCFLEYPGELARVRAHPDLLPAAIEEVVRFRSPGQIMFRETKRDVELHGQVIPAGKLVLAVVGSANRDEKVFPEPDRFDVGRAPNPHIGFGHGIHYCIGAALSRLEGRIALEDLLALEDFQLASTEPWPPRVGLHLHGPARLPVRFKPGTHVSAA